MSDANGQGAWTLFGPGRSAGSAAPVTYEALEQLSVPPVCSELTLARFASRLQPG
jgi:hypothetical protein